MGKVVEIKTKETAASVDELINAIEDESKRRDSFVVLDMMRKASGFEPKMWGASMIGFGNRRYKSPATGREVDWFVIGFSPRKANLSLHLMDISSHSGELAKLGKHKTGKGCLYINRLEDVDLKVLKLIIEKSAKRK